MVLNIIVFLLVLGVLVFVHELGHFAAAKLLGIGVEEFGIGFPPRLIKRTKKGTIYSINWLPFGGFVKLKGMDTNEDGPDSYRQAAVWKRIIVVSAGVVMNIVLAAFILFGAYLVGFSPVTQPLEQYPGAQVVKQEVIVAEVQPGSVAATAGLQTGDQIILANNQPVRTAEDFGQFTRAQTGKPVKLVIKRNSVEESFNITLGNNEAAPLGVALISGSEVRLPFLGAAKAAVLETGGILKVIALLFIDLIKQIFSAGEVPTDVVGPVGIYQATSSALAVGWQALVSLVVLLSLNLAIINILPIPALDGGYVLFLLTELIFKRKIIKDSVESFLVTMGFVLMIILLIFMTWRDLIRW